MRPGGGRAPGEADLDELGCETRRRPKFSAETSAPTTCLEFVPGLRPASACRALTSVPQAHATSMHPETGQCLSGGSALSGSTVKSLQRVSLDILAGRGPTRLGFGCEIGASGCRNWRRSQLGASRSNPAEHAGRPQRTNMGPFRPRCFTTPPPAPDFGPALIDRLRRTPGALNSKPETEAFRKKQTRAFLCAWCVQAVLKAEIVSKWGLLPSTNFWWTSVGCPGGTPNI